MILPSIVSIDSLSPDLWCAFVKSFSYHFPRTNDEEDDDDDVVDNDDDDAKEHFQVFAVVIFVMAKNSLFSNLP